MTAQNWTFLTNHAHVLICLERDPEQRVRDIAEQVGITERAVLRIIGELAQEGYITIEKDGRRNSYVITAEKPMRHPVESARTLKDLLDVMS